MSWVAVVLAILSALSFLAVAYARQRGHLVHLDIRVLARIVPVRYHPRLLQAVHPLVHLGDAVFLLPCVAFGIVVLWLLGVRRTWLLLLGLLTYPVELLCKATLDQPGALDPSGQSAWVAESVQLGQLLQGSGEQRRMLDWLSRAVPGFQQLAHHAAHVSVGLTSSFPSGTTARGAFALGLLALVCLRLPLPLVREFVALCFLAAAAMLGFAVILFAWHLPSDVLGGYLLGFGLLFTACAGMRWPDSRRG